MSLAVFQQQWPQPADHNLPTSSESILYTINSSIQLFSFHVYKFPPFSSLTPRFKSAAFGTNRIPAFNLRATYAHGYRSRQKVIMPHRTTDLPCLYWWRLQRCEVCFVFLLLKLSLKVLLRDFLVVQWLRRHLLCREVGVPSLEGA